MSKPSPSVVVIGAGMGGLAAAIDLAQTGARVTLLEAAASPGGKVRTLDVAGHAIDSGPTVFTMRWVFESLFADAGAQLDEQLRLSELDVLARHGWLDGSRLDLHSSVEQSAAAIASFAGSKEAAAYRSFAQRSEQIFQTLDHTFMRREKPGMIGLGTSLGVRGLPRLAATKPFTTLWKELGRQFRDPRLRQLFGRYATYCGSSPLQSPATLMLIAHAERAGVWALIDGMQRLPEALADLAGSLGVELRFATAANEIETTQGRVSAVQGDDGVRYPADAVVFNGDVAALSQGRLGSPAAAALPSREQEPRSLSAVTWSLVGRLEGFPLHHHTVLFGTDYEDEFRAIFERGELTAEPTLYLCAQDRDRQQATREAERLFVLVNAPPGLRTEKDLEAVETKVFALLEKHGLHVTDIDGRCERTSPENYAQRFPGCGGAIYGWPTHGAMGSFQRSGSRGQIGGLYFAGGTVHPGPGIPMATLSGRIAARAIAKDLSLGGVLKPLG